MPSKHLTEHLRELGIPQSPAIAFQALLQQGPCALSELAACLQWSMDDAAEAIEYLVDAGLVVSSGPEHAMVFPAEPTIALEHLAHARAADLKQAHLAALDAYQDFRHSAGMQNTENLVEVVTGPQIVDRIWQLERAVTSEVVRFDSPPYHTHGRPNPTELDNLEHGVTYRVVYSSSAVRNADYYASNIQPCIAAGENARVTPTVPVKLTIFDRRVALVSMSSVEARSNDSLLLVYPSSLMSALLGLFEISWRSAYPMHLHSQAPPVLRPTQRRILELLGSGITDESIAQLLNISRRTLSRKIEQLYHLSGASNRFQLALHASRQEWI
ncbi:helix-turn-helix domain-containing protein [Actinomadura geliboluensis]|uniref:Helix-turn-helix transcriptional regulator n=1 Tax=Actinomadura geliboluensis TaxID=882440 RepID=A0A5S4G929_9ACTN|nr:helix-turn-helix transcriptional regulator [Actinomadura geliboluensis]TMR29525.1 helix-turn-helix transcriptional regulator [Actinomadura geliboluensis]